MPRTAITLQAADGSTRTGEADVRTHRAPIRTAKAAALIVAGFAGAAACIIVPGLHLVTTWGLPLLGIVLGLRAYRTQASIDAGQATCPACSAAIELAPLKLGAEPASTSCPACRAPIEIALTEVLPGA